MKTEESFIGCHPIGTRYFHDRNRALRSRMNIHSYLREQSWNESSQQDSTRATRSTLDCGKVPGKGQGYRSRPVNATTIRSTSCPGTGIDDDPRVCGKRQHHRGRQRQGGRGSFRTKSRQRDPLPIARCFQPRNTPKTRNSNVSFSFLPFVFFVSFVVTRFQFGCPTANTAVGWKNANLRGEMTRLLRRAGVSGWPLLFHSMRASRRTELHREVALHVVCLWLGNSLRIARQSYLLVTEDFFARAGCRRR